MHAYVHTYKHTCLHALHTHINTYIHAHIHTYVRTYMHYMRSMHTYIHTCMHTYIHTWTDSTLASCSAMVPPTPNSAHCLCAKAPDEFDREGRCDGAGSFSTKCLTLPSLNDVLRNPRASRSLIAQEVVPEGSDLRNRACNWGRRDWAAALTSGYASWISMSLPGNLPASFSYRGCTRAPPTLRHL